MICQNFAYILEKKVDYYPNDIGVVEAHNGKSYRYIDLYHRANRLANALMDMGVTKSDRILCLCLVVKAENCLSAFGCLKGICKSQNTKVDLSTRGEV